MEKPYFKNLDVLRFFAAFFVLIGHSVTNKLQYLHLHPILNNFILLICTGSIWVSFFFVLSGFLIGYLSLVQKKSHNFLIKRFLLNRSLRIWPLYFLVVFISFGIFPLLSALLFNRNFSYNSIWYYLTFTGNYNMLEIYRLNNFSLSPPFVNITWSLSIEEQFYAFFALLLTLFSFKKIKLIFIGLIICALVFISVNVSKRHYMQYHTLNYLPDFFIGVFFAYFMLKYNKLKLMIMQFKTLQILSFFVLLITFLLLTIKVNNQFYPVIKLLQCLGFATTIVMVCFNKTTLITKIGSNSCFNYLGKMSYGIYLLHPIFQFSFYVFAKQYLQSVSLFYTDFLTLIFTLIFTLLTAFISFKYFESYFLKLKK